MARNAVTSVMGISTSVWIKSPAATAHDPPMTAMSNTTEPVTMTVM